MNLEATVRETWNNDGSAQNLSDVAPKLGNMQKSLVDWSRKDFGSVTSSIKRKRQRLKVLTEGPEHGNKEAVGGT